MTSNFRHRVAMPSAGRPGSGLFLEVPPRSSPSTPVQDQNGNVWQWPPASPRPRSRLRSRRGSGSSGSSQLSQARDGDCDDVTEASGYGYEDESDVPLAASPTCSVDHGSQGREMVNVTLPCDVDTLFALLFGGSAFFEEFHASRKTFDIKQSDWEPSPSPQDGRRCRKVSFTVTLTQPIGPKHSYLSEAQTLLPESQRGHLYAIDTDVTNAGIPYADSFYVTTHYCLSRALAGARQRHSRLIILCELRFRKSVFRLTKGFIERGTWDGMTEFYGHLERALKQECSKPDYARPLPPLSRAGSMRRSSRRPRMNKSYTAPPEESPPTGTSTGPQRPRRLSLASNGNGRRGSSGSAVLAAAALRPASRFESVLAPWRWFRSTKDKLVEWERDWDWSPSLSPSMEFSVSSLDTPSLLKMLCIILTIALVIMNGMIYLKIGDLEASLIQRRGILSKYSD